MTATLVVTFCALANPGQCEVHRYPADASCMMTAPAVIARETREGWGVRKWRCER